MHTKSVRSGHKIALCCSSTEQMLVCTPRLHVRVLDYFNQVRYNVEGTLYYV